MRVAAFLHRLSIASTLALVLAALAAEPVIAQTALDGPVPDMARGVRGEIREPATGAAVGRSFPISGTVAGQPRNLWLAVRIGDLYWPKEPKLAVRDGRWIGRVNEGGNQPGGRFVVVLLDVADSTSRMFEDWLRKGHEDRSYPGIPKTDIEEARELARRDFRL